MMHRLRTVFGCGALLLANAHTAHAADVIIDLDVGGGFVIRDNTTTVERLRVEESTGNIYRNGALLVHGLEGFYLGPNAGNPASAAAQNVGVGDLAMSSVTTGVKNTALGSEAMTSITSGVHNVAVGDFSLGTNTVGADNTAIGHNALEVALDANENTAIGSFSLASALNSGNTAVGAQALRNATGANNIAIGTIAGINLVGGNENIYIGNQGTDGDAGQLRIGTTGVQTEAYIAGIFGNAVNGEFVVVDADGRLGSSSGSSSAPTIVLPSAGAFVVQDSTAMIERFRVDEDTGNLSRNGSLLLHDSGHTTNLFLGSSAGSTGATGDRNSAFGSNALSMVSSGFSNSAFGNAALLNNTLGEGNTAIGTEALVLNVDGTYNTAIGHWAVRTNPSGSFNTGIGISTLHGHGGDGATALGAFALENNLSAPNTAVGTRALQGNQHGEQNTSVGYEAMKNISAGSPATVDLPPRPRGNTAVGHEALRDVGANGGNTAVGAEAILYSAGASNTAVGSGALRGADGVPFNAAAGENTAVGQGAMSLSAGISRYNVAVGNLALQRVGNNGQANDSATGNIAIGRRAGWNLREGDNNIYIGNEGPDTESRQIRIGTNGTHLQQHLAGDVTVEKSISVASITIRGGADIAEPFNVRASTPLKPGMVVSIDPQHAGALRLSGNAYDRTVAGVISGAGGVRPGITLSQNGSIADGAYPVAMSGRVYALADESETGAIEPGDLLTTANRPGYAMRVADANRAQGAVLGKAMTRRDPDTGLVLVLVALQ